MNTNYFNENPKLKTLFETMRSERRYEIFDYLRKTDETYAGIVKNRTEQSMILRSKLTDIAELETYMDFVYEQNIYELEAIYIHAFYDAIEALKKLGLLV